MHKRIYAAFTKNNVLYGIIWSAIDVCLQDAEVTSAAPEASGHQVVQASQIVARYELAWQALSPEDIDCGVQDQFCRCPARCLAPSTASQSLYHRCYWVCESQIHPLFPEPSFQSCSDKIHLKLFNDIGHYVSPSWAFATLWKPIYERQSLHVTGSLIAPMLPIKHENFLLVHSEQLQGNHTKVSHQRVSNFTWT